MGRGRFDCIYARKGRRMSFLSSGGCKSTNWNHEHKKGLSGWVRGRDVTTNLYDDDGIFCIFDDGYLVMI